MTCTYLKGYRTVLSLSLFALIWIAGMAAYAQDSVPTLKFPTTAEEIEDLVLKAKTQKFQPKSYQIPATKGIEKIVDDPQPDPQPLETLGAMVLFKFDSTEIEAESYRVLEAYATALTGKLNEMTVTINGHTDSTGDDAYNWQLSERRAQAIKEWLIREYRIAPERLTVMAYGETKPLVNNDTKENRALNRRVEFSFWQ